MKAMVAEREAMDSGTPGKERRRAVRYEQSLGMAIYGRGSELLDEGTTLHNISTKGMRFETLAEMKPGDVFRFNLEVPGRGIVRGKAKMCWTRASDSGATYVCGAEMKNVSWFQRRALRAYLEPHSFKWGAMFDMAFGLAMAYLLVQLSRNTHGSDARLVAQMMGKLGDIGLWLPQAAISACAMLGIYAYFSSR